MSPLLLMLSACQPLPPELPEVTDTTTQTLQEWIRERWNGARADHQWNPPPAKEQTEIAELVNQLYKAAPQCDETVFQTTRDQLSEHGLTLDAYRETDQHVWLIHEKRDAKGLGVTAIRCGTTEEIVLQAPHAIHDKWTGAIVREIFSTQPMRMAMWNSTHRYRSQKQETKEAERHPADVAHNRDTVFHQQVVVLAESPGLRFAQIHGFKDNGEWDVILSFGIKKKGPSELARRLKPLTDRIALFGQTTDKLGATTNVQAQALNQNSVGRFVHVELSASLREELKADGSKRTTLAEALKYPW